MIEVQAKRDQLAALHREVEFRQDQVDRANKTSASARLQSQLSFSNIMKLDNATPPTSPAFPKLIIVMAAGIGAGFALGIIFALLAEAFDRRIRGAFDLDFAVPAPVLGTLLKPVSRRRIIGRRWGAASSKELSRLSSRVTRAVQSRLTGA